MHLAWETVESSVIVEHEWVYLRADKCALPNGTVIEPYCVLEYPDLVSVLPTDKYGKAILVREYRHISAPVGTGLVGGAIDKSDVSPAGAARRELEEETGYLADDLVSRGTGYANWGNHNNRVHYFLAQNYWLGGKKSFGTAEYCQLIFADVSHLFEPDFFETVVPSCKCLLSSKNLNGGSEML